MGLLRTAVYAALYLAVGVVFYTSFEDKPCEQVQVAAPSKKPSWWNKLGSKAPQPTECREPWTVVDALYFCMATMSTVGYGDFGPSSDASSLFTLMYIFVGISLVFVEVSSACSGVLMAARGAFLEFCDQFDSTPKGLAGRALGLSGQPLDIDGNGVYAHDHLCRLKHTLGFPRHCFHARLAFARLCRTDFILPPTALIFWTEELLVVVILFVMTQIGSAAAFVAVQPDLAFPTALYHCAITSTTVGYGDVELTTQSARAWACVHMMFSVAWLAALLSHIDELKAIRSSQLQRADLLKRQLDVKLVSSLDHDGKGVDKLEFVVGMLMMLGCEVCGQQLSWEDVTPFLVKFDALDASKTGRIDKSDLQKMVRDSRRRSSHEAW